MWCDFIPLQLLYIFSFISYPPQGEKWRGGIEEDRKEGKVDTDGKREKERERQKTERKRRRKKERDKRRRAIYNEH